MTIVAQTLIKQINEQFGRMGYPGDDKIVIDAMSSQLQCPEIISALKGRHWRDLSRGTLDQLKSALFFLSPEGYRFYLPAFMIYSIEDFYAADVIPDNVIQTLTFPQKSDIDRIRESAKRHQELQPFSDDDWELMLRTMAEKYEDGSLECIFQERVSGFDAEQRRVIRQFLEDMEDAYGEEFPNNEPQTAIDRYWYQF